MKEQICGYDDVKDESEWDKAPEKSENGRIGPEKRIPDDGPIPFDSFDLDESEKKVQYEVVKDPSKGRRLVINVQKRTGFTDKETKRHISAAALLELVINSLEFKKKVHAKKFTTTKKTGVQIYDHIMTGEEVLQPGKDYELDVIVEMYYERSRVVGYTMPSVKWTKINRYTTANYSDADIAGNMMHEWLHKMGYGHSSARDHSSVPYAVGYMVSDMIEQYKKGTLKLNDIYPLMKEEAGPVPIPSEPIKVEIPTKEPKKICSRPWYYLWLKEVCYYEKE